MTWVVYDLPQELLASIALKDPSLQQLNIKHTTDKIIDDKAGQTIPEDAPKASTTCVTCHATFNDVQEQRQHSKSDWHSYNLRQKVRGAKTVDEDEFERLIDELEESLSGSGSSSSESEAPGDGARAINLSTLMKKQAKLEDGLVEDEAVAPKRRARGAGKPPLIWFETPLVSSNVSLGIYRALFTNIEQEAPSLVDVLRSKQLRPVPVKASVNNIDSGGVALPSTMTSPSVFMCMVGGGHFAGMIVSLSPKISKAGSVGSEQRQAIVIAHKTFHRYTTRRKQGGGQSANDAAKGAAHSAGSSLRRYNEVALEQEIRVLLSEWRALIDNAQLVFVRATGSSNRRILFGPYEGQVLRPNDPRNRGFPFSTRRATQAELMRSFVELTRIKVSRVDEAALAAAAAAEIAISESSSRSSKPVPKPVATKLSKEEEAALLHTNQLQALIRRSKVPAILSYLSTNALKADFSFFPPTTQANHHAPTLLHLASSTNSAPVVLALLTKAAADPMLSNSEGHPAFDLAGDRPTRDAFRVARCELGETRWNWSTAHVPPSMTRADADARDASERAETDKIQAERRKADEERLREQTPPNTADKRAGKPLGGGYQLPKTAEEKREEEGRGMSVEMRARLERERRARAAEARFKGSGPGR